MPGQYVRRVLPSRRPASSGLGAIAVALIAAPTLGWAPLHVRLESSVPAADSVLEAVPERFELRFSGPVNAGLSSAVLLYPSGDSAVVELVAAGTDAHTLVGEPPPLGEGPHLLRWRTVSVDGHIVQGEVPFTALRAAVTASDDARSEDPHEREPTDHSAGISDTSPAPPDRLALSGVSEDGTGSVPPNGRILLAGFALACLIAFAGMLWFAGATRVGTEPRVRRWLILLGWTALILLLADLCLWVFQVQRTVGGPSGVWAALASRIGLIATVRLLLLLLALAALRGRGRLAAVLAATALLIGAMAGHPATVQPWIAGPANAVHLSGAAMWLGGLLLLLLVPDSPSDGSEAWHFATVAHAVSGAALLAVVLIAASGVLQSVLFLGDLSAYAGTRYGRLLILKWAGFVSLFGFGAYHRFRVMPRLRPTGSGSEDAAAGASAGLRRTVRLEVVVMVLVFLVAVYLARLSPPAG